MVMKTKEFKTNLSQNPERIMVQCRTLVNRDAVRRETIDGVEHIIVSSATLPDDIVMNGGLYPADEIAASYQTLEATLAPIEHPVINGQYVSAGDPRAIHAFHAGAFNMNVRREGGRVHIDKFINVAEAMKSDRGKRLLDRIDELENNESPRPIHTSVGVFVMPEILEQPLTNAAGDEYEWIARDMVFDHDAILLDNEGAGTPEQGVGVAVNRDGKEFEVNQFNLSTDNDQPVKFDRLNTLAGNQSLNELRDSVFSVLSDSAIDVDWIEELFLDRVVFWSDDKLFEVSFTIDDQGTVTLVDMPLEVERNVTFTPKTNHSKGDAMKDLILNALKEAKVETDGMSDDELFAAYNQLQANQSENDVTDSDDAGIADIVANAVAQATQPLVEQIDGLQAKLNSADETKLNELAELIGNSDKYPGVDAEAAKKLGIDTLKSMAANCQPAFGISPVINATVGDEFKAPAEMPA